MALKRMSVMLMHGGQPAEAETQLKAAAAAFERLGMVGQQRGALFNLCVLHASQTRPEQVSRAAQMAWDLKPPQDLHPLRVHLQLAFVEAHIGLGQLGPAWHWLQGAVRDAQALGSLDVTTATLITGAELMVLLDRRQDIDDLLTRIDPAALSELQLMASEFWVTMTEWALVAGDRKRHGGPGNTRCRPNRFRSNTYGHVTPWCSPRCTWPRAALPNPLPAWPAPDLPGLSDELRWRALAVRLAAEAALGGATASTVQAADEALSGPCAAGLRRPAPSPRPGGRRPHPGPPGSPLPPRRHPGRHPGGAARPAGSLQKALAKHPHLTRQTSGGPPKAVRRKPHPADSADPAHPLGDRPQSPARERRC